MLFSRLHKEVSFLGLLSIATDLAQQEGTKNEAQMLLMVDDSNNHPIDHHHGSNQQIFHFYVTLVLLNAGLRKVFLFISTLSNKSQRYVYGCSGLIMIIYMLPVEIMIFYTCRLLKENVYLLFQKKCFLRALNPLTGCFQVLRCALLF